VARDQIACENPGAVGPENTIHPALYN
jgi:hypothetical protein